MHHDAALSVGYTIDIENIPEQYRKHLERIVHFEARYDPKTGQKLQPVEVADQDEQDIWTFQAQEFEDVTDFFDAVAEAVGGFHGVYGDVNGLAEDALHRIELRIPDEQGDYCSADFAWLAQQGEAVRAIGRKLVELGFPTDDPTATAYLVIG